MKGDFKSCLDISLNFQTQPPDKCFPFLLKRRLFKKNSTIMFSLYQRQHYTSNLLSKWMQSSIPLQSLFVTLPKPAAHTLEKCTLTFSLILTWPHLLRLQSPKRDFCLRKHSSSWKRNPFQL